MDDIYIPDETDEDEDSVAFEKQPVESEQANHPSGVNASGYIKITFDRFVSLVASRSFLEVVERNKNEEVILSTNLLTDLANAKRYTTSSRMPLMIMGGIAVGILFGYIIFNS